MLPPMDWIIWFGFCKLPYSRYSSPGLVAEFCSERKLFANRDAYSCWFTIFCCASNED